MFFLLYAIKLVLQLMKPGNNLTAQSWLPRREGEEEESLNGVV